MYFYLLKNGHWILIPVKLSVTFCHSCAVLLESISPGLSKEGDFGGQSGTLCSTTPRIRSHSTRNLHLQVLVSLKQKAWVRIALSGYFKDCISFYLDLHGSQDIAFSLKMLTSHILERPSNWQVLSSLTDDRNVVPKTVQALVTTASLSTAVACKVWVLGSD